MLDDWRPFRHAMREILADGPRTRTEIASALGKTTSLGSLATAALGAGADALYKPLHWWGDISFGPERSGAATFQRWRRGPDLPERLDDLDADAVGANVLRDYVGSYAPVTRENLRYWLTEGLSVPSRTVARWIAASTDALVEIDSGGLAGYVLREDVDALRTARPSDVVRLLPGFDPWVMGPGTADARIISPGRRAAATKGSNLVLVGGRVVGTWRRHGAEVQVTRFAEERAVDEALLDAEVRALAESEEDAAVVVTDG